MAANVQEERDLVYTMLSNAIVYKQWQPAGTGNRGFNIGSVLVDPNGVVVGWAVNCVNQLGSWTQHGEVRLMLQYALKTKTPTLRGFTIYTTLEPCAQCSGMMTLQTVARTVYCQRDPNFGDVLERLSFDGSKAGGFKPYPFLVPSEQSRSSYGRNLDLGFDRMVDPPNKKKSIAEFLYSDEARAVFAQSAADLNTYSARYTENVAVVKAAREYLAAVPDHYVELGIALE